MLKKQVTVKDIGKKLRLHYTTVSKALKDHPDISDATKRRVVTLAKELNYHPNSIAINLKKQETYTLGVIVPSIKNDFFSAVISGIEEVAYGQGFNAVVCQSNENSEREAIHARMLISSRVAGVLVSVAQTTTSGGHFRNIQNQDIPLIFFDRVCEEIDTDRVVVDDYDGARKAVRHLIRSGYKKIAHIAGPQNTSIGRDRYRGYIDELKRNGIAVDDNMIVNTSLAEEESGMVAAHELLLRGIVLDAIFTVNDLVAVGAHKEIKNKGLKIPQEMALVGFGNNRLSSYLDPPLTTVKQSPFEIGKVAAGMLLERIGNPQQQIAPRVRVIETELILRESA